MSKQVYSCLSESDNRGEALEAIQRTVTHLFNSRTGFVLTKDVNPDGSFVVTLESSGKPLEPTKAPEATVSQTAPVRSRKERPAVSNASEPSE